MPEIAPDQVVPPGSRAVFIAPHPDDEVLGMGGLMAALARQSRELRLVAVTDGDNEQVLDKPFAAASVMYEPAFVLP